MATYEIDGEWFHAKLAEKRRSMRAMARHMGIDASAVSRTFAGERRMKMEEANQIALFLGVPVSEVLGHAGAAIDLDGLPTRILLTSVIDHDGALKKLSDPKPLPQSIIERAHAAITKGINGRVIAAQVRAADGPLSSFDDAIVLFVPTETVERSAIGTMSIFRTKDGSQFFGRIQSTRKTGEATILRPDGKTEECMLSTATPVLAIIP